MKTVVAVALQAALAAAQSCPQVLTPSYKSPVVGAGWTAQLIMGGLKSPRGILLDSAGALLVVEQGSGIRRLTFDDHGGTCLTMADNKSLVDDSDVSRSCIHLVPCKRKVTQAHSPLVAQPRH